MPRCTAMATACVRRAPGVYRRLGRDSCSQPRDRGRAFRSGREQQDARFAPSGCAHHALRWFKRRHRRAFQTFQCGTNGCEHCFLVGAVRPPFRTVQSIVLRSHALPDDFIRRIGVLHTVYLASSFSNSPAGAYSKNWMGLDIRSSSSSRAGDKAWAGIRRRISAGSDRGVIERLMHPICGLNRKTSSRHRGVFH